MQKSYWFRFLPKPYFIKIEVGKIVFLDMFNSTKKENELKMVKRRPKWAIINVSGSTAPFLLHEPKPTLINLLSNFNRSSCEEKECLKS